jgi:thioesterase domain-containing protein
MSVGDPPFEGLTPQQKRAMLARLLRRQALERLCGEASPGESSMWMYCTAYPHDVSWTIQLTFRMLDEAVDVDALRAAVEQFVQRHPLLCATYREVNGRVMRTVTETPASISVHDDAISLERFHEWREQFYREPMDVERGPLFRAHLFRRVDGHVFMVVEMHHIVCDVASISIFYRELGALYDAARSGAPAVLGAPQADYSDFVTWQRDLHRDPSHEPHRAFWRRRLAERRPLLTLPGLDRETIATSGRSAHCQFHLPPAVVAPLRQLARQAGVTTFALLLACYEMMLFHHAGEQRFFVLTAGAGRGRPQFEPLVGYFINPLLMAADVVTKRTFREHLGAVARDVEAVLEHQYVWPAHMLDETDAGIRSRANCMFMYERNPPKLQARLATPTSRSFCMTSGGLAFEFQRRNDFDNPFDLTLVASEGGDHDDEAHVLGALVYNQQTFDRAAVAQLTEHPQRIVERCVSEPEAPLSTVLDSLPSPTTMSSRPVQPGSAPKPSRPLARGFAMAACPAPRTDELERTLLDIWRQALRCESITRHDEFFSVGGHSLSAARISALVRRRCGMALPLDAFLKLPTVAQQAAWLSRSSERQEASLLVPLQPADDKNDAERPPLFLIHGGGGNVLLYRDLARLLGPEQPCWGLQTERAGHDACRSVEALAQHYVEHLRTVRPHGPYLLGGESMGGKLAIEMAIQLRAQGESVPLVLLFDTFGFGVPWPRSPWRQLLAVCDLVRNAIYHAGVLRGLGVARRPAYLRRWWLRARHLVLRDREHLQAFHLVPAVARYAAKPYAGRVALLRATHQPLQYRHHERLGWDHLARLEVYPIEADHGPWLFEPPALHPLVERVRGLLTEAGQRTEDAVSS